jgi:hypothetical protein
VPLAVGVLFQAALIVALGRLFGSPAGISLQRLVGLFIVLLTTSATVGMFTVFLGSSMPSFDGSVVQAALYAGLNVVLLSMLLNSWRAGAPVAVILAVIAHLSQRQDARKQGTTRGV